MNTTPKRLTRPRDDRMLGGVCAAIARYFGVDPTIVRLLTAVGAVLGMGSLAIVYVVLWAVIPED